MALIYLLLLIIIEIFTYVINAHINVLHALNLMTVIAVQLGLMDQLEALVHVLAQVVLTLNLLHKDVKIV